MKKKQTIEADKDEAMGGVRRRAHWLEIALPRRKGQWLRRKLNRGIKVVP
jgi:hypothetical protein